MSDDRYVNEARRVKAEKIALALIEHGVTSDMIPTATEDNWVLAARLAGTRPPSPETRAWIASMLRVREAARERH